MTTLTTTPSYTGFRFPQDIIAHAVWLYFRFSLSYRDVEELLAERGVVVSYETIRQWCLKFGQPAANALRRRRPRTGDTWYLDEVFLKINGKTAYVWRAVDQDGHVLDISCSVGGTRLRLRRSFASSSRAASTCRAC
jgi:putative transposase